MRKQAGILIFLLSLSGPAWAHKGHGAVTHPIHISWGLQGAQELLNVHPLFTHFPIALLLAAVAFYVLGALFRKENLFIAGKWTLWFGALSAVATVWTGLQAAETVAHDEEIHQIMMRHQYLGIAILILSVAWSLWVAISKANIPSRGRVIFMSGLLILSAMILQEADFGGRMVFLKGVGIGQKNLQQTEQPSAVIEKWQSIESDQEHLKEIIQSGDLDNVHEVAFKIRDMVKALPDTTLSADQKIVFKSLLTEVEEEASLLDEYGDAGNKVKAQDEFEKFKKTLLSVRNLYGKN